MDFSGPDCAVFFEVTYKYLVATFFLLFLFLRAQSQPSAAYVAQHKGDASACLESSKLAHGIGRDFRSTETAVGC